MGIAKSQTKLPKEIIKLSHTIFACVYCFGFKSTEVCAGALCFKVRENLVELFQFIAKALLLLLFVVFKHYFCAKSLLCLLCSLIVRT